MSYQSVVLADSPTAYWRLGESSGTVAADTSGNGYTGAYQTGGLVLGATGLLTDDNNTAVSFPGGAATNRCMLVSPSPLKTQGAVTMEAWIKLDALTETQVVIVRSGQSADLQYGFFVTVSGALQYIYYDGSGFQVITSATGLIAINTTYHVACVRAANGLGISFYRNGIVVGTGTASSVCVASASQILTVGGATGTTAQNLDGVVDEAALYASALTAVQLSIHSRTGWRETFYATIDHADPMGRLIGVTSHKSLVGG